MMETVRNSTQQALPGPFALTHSPDGVKTTPVVSQFVATQVKALLDASPAFYQLSKPKREQMQRDLEKIAAYSAALIQDEWAVTEKLGQTPMLRSQTVITPPEAVRPTPSKSALPKATALASPAPAPAADEFSPRAVSQAAKITRDTLNAIAFPTFVADLIKGTFQAIVDASIQQMEAYGNLLANVAKTVDQFMGDNISDNNARDYLANSYPSHFRLEANDEGAKVRLRDGVDEREKPNFKSQFELNEDIDLTDNSVEEKLVPAARRYLAKSRQQLLSTMVLMGINRIVVTSGRIAAKMGFRIDARDKANAQSASQFDFKNEFSTGFGGGLVSIFGGASAETKNTIAYVSSTKKDSSDEIDMHADLTGEVDLKFKSDYFPMERFAKPEMLALIQGHTPNPTANTPTTGTAAKQAASG